MSKRNERIRKQINKSVKNKTIKKEINNNNNKMRGVPLERGGWLEKRGEGWEGERGRKRVFFRKESVPLESLVVCHSKKCELGRGNSYPYWGVAPAP